MTISVSPPSRQGSGVVGRCTRSLTGLLRAVGAGVERAGRLAVVGWLMVIMAVVVLLRASTESLLNDLERAVDDSVACVRGLCRDPRFVPGGGATEMELAHQIYKHGESQTGLDQYAIKKFAEALEVVPRILSETSGQDAEKVLAALRTAHTNGEAHAGVDVDGDSIADKTQEGVVDLMSTKESALRLAVDAAVTVLRVDQIIMSKQAGGPKPRGPQADDD
eukprot:jgi/Undpi1/1380/HiC_scaffold_11.g04772.m1